MMGPEEYNYAMAHGQDRWVPANGGTEEVITYYGGRWLYVYNPAQDKHGYLNVLTDIVHREAPWQRR